MPKPSASAHVESAPRDTEEARSLLQVRLAQFEKLGMATGLLFLVLTVITHLTLPLQGSLAAVLAQCGSSAVGAAVWLAMRRGTWQTNALHAVDVGATLALSLVFISLGWGLPHWGRPELIQLLTITDILGLRAFLVPSTLRRTAAVGVLSSAMVVVSTWFMYQRPKVHPDAPDALGYVVIAALLALGTVISTRSARSAISCSPADLLSWEKPRWRSTAITCTRARCRLTNGSAS